ncbi:MAG: hypothetical protein APR63_08945 [Desulfuromonas sp. SDB]|nr:MAG: hypothetical protein APR63_08945 [Desulfuromonas sp. SDB]
MDNDQILAICDKEVLAKAAQLCGTSKENVKFLDISENIVYEYQRNKLPLIMRISHRKGRDKKQIQAELDWILYLHDHGAPVHLPVPSIRGNLVETVKVRHQDFQVVSFGKLEGKILEDEDVTDEFIPKWGQAVGKLHALTKDYQPLHPDCRRFEWCDEDDIVNLYKYIPVREKLVRSKFRILIEKLKNLPQDRDSYGLIHSDIHYGNFLVKDGKIGIFDFDDSMYSWFMLDIATIWYWALYLPQGDDDKKGYMNNFKNLFLEGYRRENEIDEWWLDKISLFLQYQEMLLFTYMCRIYNLNKLTENQQELLNKYKNRIENDILFFGMME